MAAVGDLHRRRLGCRSCLCHLWSSPLRASLRAQRERYARHLLIPDIGELGQRRLLAARVAVMGAGGLGSPAPLYLAAAGVGSVIDDDVVDLTNLQRQVIHDDASVGTPKVASAAARLRAQNPDVTVTQRQWLTDENADEILAGHDLVLDGTRQLPHPLRGR